MWSRLAGSGGTNDVWSLTQRNIICFFSNLRTMFMGIMSQPRLRMGFIDQELWPLINKFSKFWHCLVWNSNKYYPILFKLENIAYRRDISIRKWILSARLFESYAPLITEFYKWWCLLSNSNKYYPILSKLEDNLYRFNNIILSRF